MPEFSISCPDFEEGGEIPKKFGYKFENEAPSIQFENIPQPAFDYTNSSESIALIMDDPDAMAAVGKVWVHWLFYQSVDIRDSSDLEPVYGKTDFGEIGYGGPAPPDKRHTYVFKAYALNKKLDLKEGYSKQELEDAMKGHIIVEANLTGTYAP